MFKITGEKYQWKPNVLRNYVGSFEVINFRNACEIWCLNVKKRNQNYGTQMLKEFVQKYNGNDPIVLYVTKRDTQSISMYESAGFQIINEHNEYVWKMKYIQ